MNAMRQAMERAGFRDYPERRSQEAKRSWLASSGLRKVTPIPGVRVHLGVVRTAGGLEILDERIVVRTQDAGRGTA